MAKKINPTSRSASEHQMTLGWLNKLNQMEVPDLGKLLIASPTLTLPNYRGSYRSIAELKDIIDGLPVSRPRYGSARSYSTTAMPDIMEEDHLADKSVQQSYSQSKARFEKLIRFASPFRRTLVQTKNQSTQMNFSTLLELEGRSNGTLYIDQLECLKLATRISVKDSMATQCMHGNVGISTLEGRLSPVTYAHLSHHQYSTDQQRDVATQTVQIFPGQSKQPSQMLHGNISTGWDFSMQCDLIGVEKLIDRAGYQSTEVPPITDYNVRTIGSRMDQTTSCDLPPFVKTRLSPLRDTSAIINNCITSAFQALHLDRMLHPVSLMELSSHANEHVAASLNSIKGKHIPVIQEYMLVNWILATGYLSNLHGNILINLEDAIEYLDKSASEQQMQVDKQMSNMTIQDTVTHRSIHKLQYEAEFLSMLKDPTVANSHDAQLRKRQIDADMSKLKRGSGEFSPTSSVYSPENIFYPKAQGSKILAATSVSEVFSKNSRKISLDGQKIDMAHMNWKKLKKLVLSKRKSNEEMVRMKRMAFLDDLIDELSAEELSLLQAIFLTINKSETCFITVGELCELLSEALSTPYTETMGRKIMREVDIDRDGFLCFIDLFGIFYLTEVYMQSLGDGFRDPILAETASSYTSCHALAFIAISEVCFYNGHRLALETNAFIRQCEKSNIIRNHGDYKENSMAGLDTRVNRMFCFSLIGLDHGVLESICKEIHDINRLKLSPLWPEETSLKPSFNGQSNKLELHQVVAEVYNKFAGSKEKTRFFQTLSNLSKPLLPDITLKPRVSLEPPYVFCHQGVDTLLRVENTGCGFENRSNSAGTKHALLVIKELDKRGVTLAQIFQEKTLFADMKLHHLVKTYCYNAMPMWPRVRESNKSKVSLSEVRSAKNKTSRPLPRKIYNGSSQSTGKRKIFKLPPIYPESQQPPSTLSQVYRESVEVLELRYGGKHSKLSWWSGAKANQWRKSILDEASGALKLNSVYDSLRLWKKREQRLLATNQGDLLPSIYRLHTTYLPQKVNEVVLPSIGNTRLTQVLPE